MMMLMRHMIYSKVPYLLFLMNTSPSTLKTFLVVVKVTLGLLLGYYTAAIRRKLPLVKKPARIRKDSLQNIAGTEI